VTNQAHAAAPITPSGLNTQVNLGPIQPPGKVQYDITGGTRPGGGTNLFHSFGDFNLPNNNIANFLNDSGLATTNILGRVTGGNISNIFGTIQTTNFGNANLFLMNPVGFLFGPTATVNVGGMVSFTSADYLKLTDGVRFNAIPDAAADALLSTVPVAAFGFLGTNPGAITVQGSQLSVNPGQGIELIGGDITIQSGTLADGTTVQPVQLSAPGGHIHLASVASSGEILAGTFDYAPNVTGHSFGAMGTIQISQKSVIDASGDGGGTVLIRGGRFVIDDSTISANVSGPGPVINGVESIGRGIDIIVNQDAVIQNGAVIETNVLGNATPGFQYGGVHVKADRIEIIGTQDFNNPPFTGVRSDVAEANTGGNSGDIKLEANSLLVKDFGTGSTTLETVTQGAGSAGNIILKTSGNLEIDGAAIDTESDHAPGNAGNIELTSAHGNISVTNFGVVTTQTVFSSGNTGKITASAPEGDIVLDGAFVFTATRGTGAAGQTQITANNLELMNGSVISDDNFGLVKPGGIAIALSGNLNLADSSVIATVSVSPTGAPAADLNITAKDIVVTQESLLTSATFVAGPGGHLKIVADTLQLTEGGQITSGSTKAPPRGALPQEIPTGPGGDITIQAIAGPTGSVLIDGPGSGIFTETQGSGTGGNIEIIASQSVTLTNRATVSASSTGQIETPGGAGSINITATNGLTMQNSAITTQAGQGASGGDIKVTTAPSATVLLENSRISASVADGRGGGGNISIDPQFVILQNSQILAQAAQGQGGAITIIANLFLPDATSIVNADSGSGLHGTVTIQSPNAPASGKIIPLSQKPLLATSLLNQHCASLAGGEFSSFTVAGRDSLPTEPGSWQASPFVAFGAGEGLGVRGEGGRVRGAGLDGMMLETSPTGETALLSLRQITPAGFLTQAFAGDWSAGCQS
jgi:filamentous hemagglutinin family protein